MSLFTQTQLQEMLDRAEMAHRVDLPIEQFRDLVYQAIQASPAPEQAVPVCRLSLGCQRTTWNQCRELGYCLAAPAAPAPDLRAALKRAAYALFQIKRMVPEAIVEFARQEHKAACDVLDGEPAPEREVSVPEGYVMVSDEVMDRIKSWSEAYPLSVFPEPDFKKARKLLEAGDMTIDSVSASNMRHVITKVWDMLQSAKQRGA